MDALRTVITMLEGAKSALEQVQKSTEVISVDQMFEELEMIATGKKTTRQLAREFVHSLEMQQGADPYNEEFVFRWFEEAKKCQ